MRIKSLRGSVWKLQEVNITIKGFVKSLIKDEQKIRKPENVCPLTGVSVMLILDSLSSPRPCSDMRRWLGISGQGMDPNNYGRHSELNLF